MTQLCSQSNTQDKQVVSDMYYPGGNICRPTCNHQYISYRFQFEIVTNTPPGQLITTAEQQMLILAIIPLPAGLSCLSTHEQLWQLWGTQLLFPVWDVHVPLIHSAGTGLVIHRRTVQVLQIEDTQPEVAE